jgi:hypothetical protein
LGETLAIQTQIANHLRFDPPNLIIHTLISPPYQAPHVAEPTESLFPSVCPSISNHAQVKFICVQSCIVAIRKPELTICDKAQLNGAGSDDHHFLD